MYHIGFSTSALHKININRFSKNALDYFRSLGCSVVELNCNFRNNLNDLSQIDKCDLNKFNLVALHLPYKDVSYKNDKSTKSILSKVRFLHLKYNFNLISFHPDKVEDWKVFKDFTNLPLAVENMDCTRKDGRNIQDIKEILDDYKSFDFVLDLQHCYTIDKSMKLALKFVKKFKNKIKEIHISGYHNKYNHFPLFKTKQNKIIINELKTLNKPIIIESDLSDFNEGEKELSYIKRY
jgi:hypothetical protein